MNNKYPIPGSRGYTVDLDTHMVYAPNGRHMKPHVDSRKRVCTKVMMETGKQRLFVIKDIVKRIKDNEGNPLEKQQLDLENEYKLQFLITQLSTYNNIMLNIDELRTIPSDDDKCQYLRGLGLGLDMELAQHVVTLIK
tara:strand:- start:136 stop:549 length:414 start_codon:yes stop_codon:yes gene_type:complete